MKLSKAIVLISTVAWLGISSWGQEAREVESARDHSEFKNLARTRSAARPTDTSKKLSGTVIFKSQSNNEEWPYFMSNGIEYRLETCEENCKAQIAQCEHGDFCTLKGDIIDGKEPMIKAQSLKILSYGTKALGEGDDENEIKSINGCLFKRDTFNPKLGEAWKSPRGTVWGELEKSDDGSPLFVNEVDAEKHCAVRGAHLPSVGDWDELGKCFTDFRENTVPLRDLFMEKFWGEDSRQIKFVYNTRAKKGKIPAFLFDEKTEGHVPDLSHKAFVRCVFSR